jgi:hypothetical protein
LLLGQGPKRRLILQEAKERKSIVRTLALCQAKVKARPNTTGVSGRGHTRHALLKTEPIIIIIIIIIDVIISCRRFSFFPGTSPLEPVVNPTTQASSLSL